LREVVAAAVVLIGQAGQPAINEGPLVPTIKAAAQAGELVVGSAEWDRLENRRIDLLEKMCLSRLQLSAQEQDELDELERVTQAALDKRFPLPTLTPEEREKIRQAMKPAKDSNGR
jgi:hypothetical protein